MKKSASREPLIPAERKCKKLTNKKWLELINEHEEQIVNTVGEAYRLACGASDSLTYCVELDQLGRVGIAEFIGGNSWSGEVHDGKAIEISRISAFDPTDGDDFNYFPKDDICLTDEQKKDLLAWAEENCIEKPTPSDMYDWNPEVYHQWYREYCENYLGCSDFDAYEELDHRRKELSTEW